MAKRSRASGRPGQRRPLDRSARARRSAGSGSAGTGTGAPASGPARPIDDTKPVTAPRGASLTDDELARAAELEAQIVAEEKAAAAQRAAASRAGRGRAAALSTEPLSVRAAQEYAYVARDVRRITIVGGIMFAILIALHVLINVTGVLTF